MFGQFDRNPAAYINMIVSPFGAAYVLERHTDGRGHLPERNRVPGRSITGNMSSQLLAWAGLVILQVVVRAS
jgi:hypothetical protein